MPGQQWEQAGVFSALRVHRLWLLGCEDFVIRGNTWQLSSSFASGLGVATLAESTGCLTLGLVPREGAGMTLRPAWCLSPEQEGRDLEPSVSRRVDRPCPSIHPPRSATCTAVLSSKANR